MNSVRKGAKDIIEVTMNEGKAVKILPNQIKTLFTPSLSECNGILILSKCKDGNPLAIMTHFAPTNIGANMNRLGQLIQENMSMINKKIPPKVFFAFNGDWVKKDGKFTMEAKNLDVINRLETIILTKFKKIEKFILPYSIQRKEPDSSALIAKFSENNPNKVFIQSVGHHYKNVEI